jgi:hypothetical protein
VVAVLNDGRTASVTQGPETTFLNQRQSYVLPADFRLSVNVNEDNSAYKFKHGLGNDQFVQAAFIGPRLGVPYVAMRIKRPNGLHPHPSFLFFPVIDNPDLSCSDKCALFDYVMIRAIDIV